MLKNYSLYITVLLGWIFLTGSVQKTKNDAPCKKLLEDYLEQVKQFKIPEGKKVYYINMEIATVMKDNTESSDVELEILISKNQVHYLSNYISVYQDEKDIFTIVYPQKTIIWTSNGFNATKNSRIDQFSALQDTLLASSTLLNCEDMTTKEGLRLKKITLKPNSSIVKKHGISKMDYYYNMEKKRLIKVVMDYTAKSSIVRKTITYKTMDFNYKANMSQPVKYKVFDKNDRLLPVYKNYELTDNR